MSENIDEVQVKKGWSWMGFLFAPQYYAGYGNIKKGVILGIIGSIIPIILFFVGIYGGLKAKKELPIKQINFNWLNAILVSVMMVAIGFASEFIITNSLGNVNLVKNGTLAVDTSITVGNAFDNYKYFDKTKWTDLKTANGRKIVQFEGLFNDELSKKIFGDNDEIKNPTVVVQFKVNSNNDTFDIYAIAMKATSKTVGNKTIDIHMTQQEVYAFLKQIYDNELL